MLAKLEECDIMNVQTKDSLQIDLAIHQLIGGCLYGNHHPGHLRRRHGHDHEPQGKQAADRRFHGAEQLISSPNVR